MVIKSIFIMGLVFCFPSAFAQLSIGPGGWVTVQSGGSLYIDTDVHIKSVAGASGYLSIWVDLDIDGNWGDPGEKVIDQVPLAGS